MSYEPTSPSGLVWIKSPSNKVPVGSIAGGLDVVSGYYQVTFRNKHYMAHRLVILLHGLVIPKGMEVDHIDRIRSNNLISNLRVVNSSANNLNKGRQRRNITGVTGINIEQGVFVSTYKSKYLGRSKDFFEAVCLRKSAESKEIT